MKPVYRFVNILLPVLFYFSTYGQDVLTLSNAQLTVQSNGLLTIQGGLNATAGSSIINNGTLQLTNNSTANSANWTDNTTTGMLSGTGLVNFNSTHSQNIFGTTVFYNVEVNNAGLDLQNNDLTIANVLKLTNGKINTGSYLVYLSNPNPVALTVDATNTLFINSYINGRIKRGISSNTFPYYFPVGNTNADPLLFQNNNITGPTQLTASLVAKPGTDAGLNVTENGVLYTSVNNGGVWNLTSDNPVASGSYDLRLYFTGFIGLTDNSFGILGRSELSANAADWSIPQNGTLNAAGGPGRMVSDGYALRKGITVIPGQFGIGMTSIALPIKILYFKGIRTLSGNLLEWSTSLEMNSNFFEVERIKGNRFEKIGQVTAAGTTAATTAYRFLDAAPFAGKNLYRLRMVDKNGAFLYSDIITLDYDAVFSVVAMPNPVVNLVSLKIVSPQKAVASIYLIDASGRRIKMWSKDVVAGVNIFPLDIQNISAGNYSLRILLSNGNKQTVNLIKTKSE